MPMPVYKPTVGGRHFLSGRIDVSLYRKTQIDEMKSVIIDNSIPFKNNDFFVKKAEIELNETSER